MAATLFKRLILRAVLRNVYPMVIRLVAVPDSLDLSDFDDIFHPVLSWDSSIGYAFRIQGQESSTASSARPDPKRSAISDYIARRSFSTPSVRSTSGNGGSAWSIRKMGWRVSEHDPLRINRRRRDTNRFGLAVQLLSWLAATAGDKVSVPHHARGVLLSKFPSNFNKLRRLRTFKIARVKNAESA